MDKSEHRESKVMGTGRLAIYGGKPTLRRRYRDRWRRIRRRDLAKIVFFGLRDINTRAGGGPISRFEGKFCDLTDSRYGLTVNSGTAALHSAFFAVGAGPGTEVIVPTYTFFASAAPILPCGATPVFCDIDPLTLTADPDDVERRITSRTRAICVVHVWGNPARMDRFVEISKKHGVALIEDCSHAHGATFQGRPVGGWGDVGCFSLQGLKAVSGGELGIAVTNNPELYDRMLVLAHFGRTGTDQAAGTFDIDGLALGLKYRPHLYGVILAEGSLSRLSELNRLRRRNYAILTEELKDCSAVQPIASYPESVRGGLLEFILKFDPSQAGGWNRGAFITAAQAEGVPLTVDRYTLVGRKARLLHEAPLFTHVAAEALEGFVPQTAEPAMPRPTSSSLEEFPGAESIAERLVRLPPFTRVSENYVRACGRGLRKVAEQASKLGTSLPE